MKLLPILLAPLLATATIVYPKTSTDCSGSTVGSFSSCGCTNLRNYVIRSATVNYERATARFHREVDCQGARISVASDTCWNMNFWPRAYSVNICGGTCSNACP